jgi:hypothetical protein
VNAIMVISPYKELCVFDRVVADIPNAIESALYMRGSAGSVLMACASITFPLRLIARSKAAPKASPSINAVTASFGAVKGNASIAARRRRCIGWAGLAVDDLEEIQRRCVGRNFERIASFNPT